MSSAAAADTDPAPDVTDPAGTRRFWGLRGEISEAGVTVGTAGVTAGTAGVTVGTAGVTAGTTVLAGTPVVAVDKATLVSLAAIAEV